MPPSLRTGKDVLCFCTSCRMDLNHTIVAMQGDRILKVECRTCRKTHAFRAPKGASAPVVRTTREPRAVVEVRSLEDEWRKRQQELSGKPTKPYSIAAVFSVGDRVQHPNFGEGFVEKVIYPNKMEVLFRGETKVLIHQSSEC